MSYYAPPPAPVVMQPPAPVIMQAPAPVIMQAPAPIIMQAPQPVFMPPPVQQTTIIQQAAPQILKEEHIPPPNVRGQTSSVSIKCPNCKTYAPTNTSCSISSQQCLLFVICFLFIPACALAPCYIPSCYNYSHRCSA